MRRSPKAVRWALPALVLALSGLPGPAAAEAAGTRPFSLTITHVECIDDCSATGLEAALEGHADFYAKVRINGVEQPKTPTVHNNRGIDPFWVVATQVPDTLDEVPVTIQVWDEDDTSGPDNGDVSPRDEDSNLDLTYRFSDGRWTSDEAGWPASCATGDGGDGDQPRVKVCFDVAPESDTDGDALLDGWERNGYNADGDDSIDVDLPKLGASPDRKDVFIEVDCLDAIDHTHCPEQAAILDAVQAFADAPVANPDGSRGIELHADTGTLYGPGVTSVPRADGGPATGTFGNLGDGGDLISEEGNRIVDFDGAKGRPGTDIHTIKAAPGNAFVANRRFIFRWVLFAHQVNARAAANDCTSGWAEGNAGQPGNDIIVSLGGSDGATPPQPCWAADAKGNSVGSVARQTGTLMHELGHSMGLGHGGGDEVNRKPNYWSVMNYAFTACRVTTVLPASPGGCDFSRHDLPDLVETMPPGLDECAELSGALGLGLGGVDFNGDGAQQGASCAPATPNYQADVNGDTSADADGDGERSGSEPPLLSTLGGFDDWSALRFDFRNAQGFADGAPPPPFPDEADPRTARRAEAAFADLVRPELDVDVTGPADALPGDRLTYAAGVANTGHGPALEAELRTEAPDGAGADYALGILPWGERTGRTAASLVPCDAADGAVLTATAAARAVDMLGNRVTAGDHARTTVHTPDLELVATATPAVGAGEAITYRITYENAGTGAATDVAVTEVLPAGVHYSAALDQGAGPKPDSVALDADGTRTLTWEAGTLAGGSGPRTIEFTARPTLLALGGTELTHRAALDFSNANGCAFEDLASSSTTTITVAAASRDPRTLGFWRNHDEQWTGEVLARVQATDQRFDGADGSLADGRLSAAEVTAALAPGGSFPHVLEEQLLAMELNLATRRINAGTAIESATADRLGLGTVRDAALHAMATLELPVSRSTRPRYSDSTTVADEVNMNLSEVY